MAFIGDLFMADWENQQQIGRRELCKSGTFPSVCLVWANRKSLFKICLAKFFAKAILFSCWIIVLSEKSFFKIIKMTIQTWPLSNYLTFLKTSWPIWLMAIGRDSCWRFADTADEYDWLHRIDRRTSEYSEICAGLLVAFSSTEASFRFPSGSLEIHLNTHFWLLSWKF